MEREGRRAGESEGRRGTGLEKAVSSAWLPLNEYIPQASSLVGMETAQKKRGKEMGVGDGSRPYLLTKRRRNGCFERVRTGMCAGGVGAGLSLFDAHPRRTH